MPNRSPSIEILRRAFPGIHLDEAQEMSAVGTLARYAPGVALCHEDTIESTFYVLLEGEAQVTKRVSSQQEPRVLKELKAGDFFGEMALIHNSPRAASVITTSAVLVLEIEKDDFRRLLEKSNAISLTMVREVSRRLRENDQMALEDVRTQAGELARAYEEIAEQEIARDQAVMSFALAMRAPLANAKMRLQEVKTAVRAQPALSSAVESAAASLDELAALLSEFVVLQRSLRR